MSSPSTRNPFTIRRLFAVLAVGMLTLASCGGGGSSDATDDSKAPATSTEVTSDETDDGGADDGPVESAEPVAVLPIDAEPPSGFRAASDHCRAEPGTEDPEGTYRTWIGYGVPEDWTNAGSSTAGGGGTSDTQSLIFDTAGEDGPQRKVEIEVDWDNLDPDGQILGSDGEVFESFDYEIKYMGDNERTVEITYDEVGDVEVGDGTADLYYRDPAQDADELGTEGQYKARVIAYEMPRDRSNLDELTPHSFVVTITFDVEDVDLTQDTVEEVLGSFMMPQCTWDDILADGELMLGVDLDGDGHVRDATDVQDELGEMMDELPPEIREQYDEMREELEAND